MRRLVGIAAVIVVVAVAAYAYHLNSTLIAVTKRSGADLRTAQWSPSQEAANSRSIDLGYATCRVPADISGHLQRAEKSMFVSIAAVANQPQITFCPPMTDNDPDARLLIDQIRLLGIPVDTLFDLKKRSLASMPFTLSQAVIWGRTKSAREAMLLTLKSLSFPTVDSEVKFFENESLGLFIYRHDDSSSIDLYDKRAGVSQTILVRGSPEDILRTADALASSYQIVGAPNGTSDFEAMLTSRNLPQLPAPSPQERATPRSEAERLEQVAKEIEQRRTPRN